MSRTLLLAGLTALSLSAIWVKAEESYPAASFEPKVIYRAEQQIPQAEYPAANFTPQVIFQDPNLIQSTGPTLESLSADVPKQLSETLPAKEPKTPPRLGVVSDVSPPYAALGLAVAAITLAFWWASRRQAKALEPFDPTPAQSGEVGQEAQGIEEEEEKQDLEALALEVEKTLATTNRQRAGKTKRTRRR